jgi:hypothetical protein
MRRSGLHRLLTVLSLVAALAFGTEPLTALASEAPHGDSACLAAASAQHPDAAGHHGSSAHASSCCGMLCVPALAADDASVPPPDLMPTGAIHSADTSETGIELTGPSPPPRP